MSADREHWSKTNIWHGHADTVSVDMCLLSDGLRSVILIRLLLLHKSARRQGLNKMGETTSRTLRPRTVDGVKSVSFGFQQQGLSRVLIRNRIIAFYFLSDILRSLNYGMPSSFRAFDLSIPLASGTSFRTAYESLVIDLKPCGALDDPDDSLLMLLGILSEILTLHYWLGPISLCSENSEAPFQSDRSPSASYDAPNIYPDLALDTQARVHRTTCNPFLHATGPAEHLRISTSLRTSLVLWEGICLIKDKRNLHQRNEHEPTEGLVPLYLFCHLLLSGGPAILLLPRMLGYSPDAQFKAPERSVLSGLPRLSKKTIDIAWQTLDALEDERRSFTDQQSTTFRMTPLWNPIITFYAAIVIWTSLHVPDSLNNDHGPAHTRRMLRLFEIELKDMQWSSAQTMSGILNKLRNM